MDTIPSDIRTGMKVLDSANHEIGHVDDFKFSENAIDPSVTPAGLDGTDQRQTGSLVENLAEAIAPDDMPEALRARLQSEGYIRIGHNGLFSSARYILPEQIASASGDTVVLNVDKDELVKR